MSKKTIITEFKGGGKHICLSCEVYHLDSAFKACDLGAVFLLEQYALEIKYSEEYADEVHMTLVL